MREMFILEQYFIISYLIRYRESVAGVYVGSTGGNVYWVDYDICVKR